MVESVMASSERQIGTADLTRIDCSIPLVVDLDGTLLLTDTLHESFVATLFRSFGIGLASALKGLHSRAAAKRFLSDRHELDVALLPARANLVELIRAERDRGREIHLVTAADQSIADRVRSEFGLFASATGSNGVRNLKGEVKLAYLQQRFPAGFLYAGDSVADGPIFRASRGAILCDLGPAVARDLATMGTRVLAEFDRGRPSAAQWVLAARPHQWSKNVLIFVPLIAGHAMFDRQKLIATAFGFLILCVLASATYMLNDLADLDADRRHPTKRYRSFASGRISIASGMIVAALGIVTALVAAFALSRDFALVLSGYFLLTMLYSFQIKRIPLLDVFVIGTLFTSRILMGAAVSSLDQSAWLLAFSMSFFFSLALAKRHVELMRAGQDGQTVVQGRGYRSDDWPLTLVFGIGTGLTSVLIMLLYLTNDAAPSGFYPDIAWLYVIPAAITLWIMRIWLLSHRTVLDDDPIVFALRDPASWALGVVVAIAFALAI
jgi:4-hydroxybenzoate polyprenyltransferase/phosphoserine phosphatase